MMRLIFRSQILHILYYQLCILQRITFQIIPKSLLQVRRPLRICNLVNVKYSNCLVKSSNFQTFQQFFQNLRLVVERFQFQHKQLQQGMMRMILRAARMNNRGRIFFLKSNENEMVKSRQQLLQRVALKLNIELYPSIIEKQEQAPAKRLTNADKIQLGLYIPKSPFNHRLSKHVQKQYLPHVTKQLYLQQRQNFDSYFRILQNNLFLESKGATLDKYVNLIYKDIYARYLVSRGIGVEWNGFYADRGVMNEFNTGEYNNEEKMIENFSILLDFIQNQASNIKTRKTIGMYSYQLQKFIPTNRIELEKIKKFGYYIKAEFTQFGNFGDQFQTLEQKNGKAYLLVFVQQLQKLINPNAICVKEGDKFVILKRFIGQQSAEIEYLMVALECYRQHQKYFKDKNYQRNSTFDGKYLTGMKALGLPIILQLIEYQRAPNCYLVNSNCHVADFQRSNASNIPHLQPFISQRGQIVLDGQPTKIFIYDLKITQKLQNLFNKRGVNFMDFYDYFDDVVYYDSETKNVLKFRIGHKYYIDIEGNGSTIFEAMKKQGSIISQSKIQVPNQNPGRKPKDRRKFRKQRKQMQSQITQHYTLQESINQLNFISISSLSESSYSILLFTKNGRVLAYDEVLSEEQMENMVKNDLKQQTVEKIKRKGITMEKVYANDELIQGLLYLKNIKNSKQILNVIIQPQSQTQILVPYALHLNFLINKDKRRRRGMQQIKNNINMIKLHPTFDEKVRSVDIKAMIQGVMKSNGKQQYGLGFEALRLWTAKNDHIMGDREITQTDINNELVHGSRLRRVYWDLLSLMPQKIKEGLQPKLYINTFVLDSIDCYITHMQQCYKNMDIHKAYQLTNDFFFNLINEIYVKSIRKRIIAFPNSEENQEHFVVIRRILELLPVISPLFPFSSYHISKRKMLDWPQIKNSKFYESLLVHNEMTKTRINIINKLQLNKLPHACLYIETLKQPYSLRDLQLFFDIDKATTRKPDEDSRKFSVQLSKNCHFSDDSKAIFFINEDHCIRCDSKSSQTQHLCSSCLSYLQQQIGQPYKYFPSRCQQISSIKIDNL